MILEGPGKLTAVDSIITLSSSEIVQQATHCCAIRPAAYHWQQALATCGVETIQIAQLTKVRM